MIFFGFTHLHPPPVRFEGYYRVSLMLALDTNVHCKAPSGPLSPRKLSNFHYLTASTSRLSRAFGTNQRRRSLSRQTTGSSQIRSSQKLSQKITDSDLFEQFETI